LRFEPRFEGSGSDYGGELADDDGVVGMTLRQLATDLLMIFGGLVAQFKHVAEYNDAFAGNLHRSDGVERAGNGNGIGVVSIVDDGNAPDIFDRHSSALGDEALNASSDLRKRDVQNTRNRNRGENVGDLMHTENRKRDFVPLIDDVRMPEPLQKTFSGWTSYSREVP